MVKIVTDTSALFHVEEGKALGIEVLPLCVMVDQEQRRDLCFDTKTFLKEIANGAIPSTSQPPIGEMIEVYEHYPQEDIIHICMADGLSGTYQTALSARSNMANKDHIFVVNSKTLCGPHRYLVEKAMDMVKRGAAVEAILSALQESIAKTHSFLIPQDFSFLKRGGRVKGAAAAMGGLLKLKPIMEAVDDGTRLDKFDVTRTMGKAVAKVIETLKERGVGAQDILYVSHADVLEQAQETVQQLQEHFPDSRIELLELSPAFIAQGGPSCIAIQSIRK